MKHIIIAFLVVMTTVHVAAEDKAAIAVNYTTKISELSPQKWAVKSVMTNTVPYNLGIKQDQRRGTSLELVGPSVVKGPRGINDENESFLIWIMPAEYTPIPLEGALAQFGPAQLLGSNDTIAIYYTSFTSATPSWKTWKDDIIKHLKLRNAKMPNQALQRTPIGVAELER